MLDIGRDALRGRVRARTSQKDSPVRSCSSSRAWRATAARPCSTRPSAVRRSNSSGMPRIWIPALGSAVVWFSAWVVVVCDLWRLSVDTFRAHHMHMHDGLRRWLGPKVLPREGAMPCRNGWRLSDAGCMRMRFLRRSATAAGTPVGDLAAETAPEDQADWSRPPAVADRACCCPGRPVVRVLIPPTPVRPHSVDLLLCGHHYRACRAGLTAARAVVISLKLAAFPQP